LRRVCGAFPEWICWPNSLNGFGLRWP